MTPEQEQALLDVVALGITSDLDAAHAELMRMLDEGVAPRDAVAAALATFQVQYAETLATAFTAILEQSVGTASVMAMQVSGVSLSAWLYHKAKETGQIVAGIIDRYVKGWQDARKLTLELYEGYGFKDREVINVTARNKRMPKYLRQELLTDPGITGEMARLFARVQTSALKTPALKAAYMEYLDAIKDGKGQAFLRKRLRVAFHERMRYFANRIAQTELHRAYADRQAAELMQDADVVWVQYRMSGTHPRADICDLFAKRDLYGLGPGVYPKAACPKAPCHPHCRCVVSPRLDIPAGAKASLRRGADRAYLRSMDASEAAKVLGSRERLQDALNGADPMDIWNRDTDPLYKVRTVGDVAKSMATGVDAGMSDAYDIAKSGGKHSGFLNLWAEKDAKSILKSMESLQGQIDLHRDKIANPDNYFTEPVSAQRREGLVKRHWPKEIRTFQAQYDILSVLLKEKRHGKK